MNNTYITRISSLLTAVFCVIIISMPFCACDRRSVKDNSERRFNTVHFCGSNNIYRKASVGNGSDIVYADGGFLYDYSTQKKIDIIRGEIRVLALSKSALFVLYEDNILYIYDIRAAYENTKIIRNVEYVSCFADMVVIKKPDNEAVCFHDDDHESKLGLNEMICGGEKYGDSKGPYNIYLSYIDGTPVYSDMVDDSGIPKKAYIGYTAFVNDQPLSLDGHNISVSARMFFLKDIFYVRNGYSTIHKKGDDSCEYTRMDTGDYYSSDTNRMFFNNCVYELVQSPDYKGGEWAHPPYIYNFPQYLTVNDRLIATDLEKACGYVVYETENNLTRIVGFNGETVYLFNVDSYTLSALDIKNIPTDGSVVIKQLPEKEELSFEWCEDVLFVYDSDQNVVDITET